MKVLLAAMLALAALSGCSLLATVSEDKNQLAVQYATLKVLERDDVSSTRVIELVEQAKAFAENGVEVSISRLAEEARNELDGSGMSMADKMLVEAILTRAEERIAAAVGDGALNSDQRLQLLTILNWIEDAARLSP